MNRVLTLLVSGMIQQNMAAQQHNLQRMPATALFPQQTARQDASAFIQQQQAAAAAAAAAAAVKSTTSATMMRNMPRVKLARDGRLHRVPDMRNKFSSLIPPAVQQHMQQQSLAQIQQYTAAISRGEDPAKETLPENMKPVPSPIKPVSSPSKQSDSPAKSDQAASPRKSPEPVEKIIVEEEPQVNITSLFRKVIIIRLDQITNFMYNFLKIAF